MAGDGGMLYPKQVSFVFAAQAVRNKDWSRFVLWMQRWLSERVFFPGGPVGDMGFLWARDLLQRLPVWRLLCWAPLSGGTG